MAIQPKIHRILPNVTCPGCRVWMMPIVVDSVPADRIDVTYRCDRCGTEIQRTVKSHSQ
jgi:DNA-directed RNA polymerase subunit RPC12/RpoP